MAVTLAIGLGGRKVFFVKQALLFSALCLAAIFLAVTVPRRYFAGKLRRQLKQSAGEVFTPDRSTWQRYLAKVAPKQPLGALALYLAVLLAALAWGKGSLAVAVGLVVFGVYLLVYQLLVLRPPTYGITGKGVTLLTWLPSFPLGVSGAGSSFIPWQAVELCAIDDPFIVLLTNKAEARLVFPPEREKQVCALVDSILRQRGYKAKSPAIPPV